MLIKPNWDNFKAKFSENPQDNFEWFCYLLFSKEYNQPYGIHRYKNQSGIETDPIKVDNEVIGWQSKFYEDTLSNHKDDLLGTLTKTKRDNPNITKIILYTNSEWGQGQGAKEPKAKIETEERAKELNIDLVWRTRSYFESSFVCQEKKDISRYFFELDSKWELTPFGFLDTLKSKYLNNFKTISLLANDKKPIDDIFINLAIIKEEEKKKDNPKLINREPILSSYEEIYKPKEPIAIKELINISKKSLIYGKAGIGKTTLCKYISYKWAKAELYQEFEYVIYIALREWKTKGLKGAIKDNYYSQDEEKITLEIKANNSQMLFLFDGYDELDGDKKKILRDEIEHYGLSHYIITTRPYGYQKSDFRVDEYFETIGFTNEDVEKYINVFFKENNDKAKSLKAYLKTNISIKHIGYIPLMLEMICSEWKKKEFNESLTMTELYTQSIENIFFEYTEKNGTAYIQDKEEEIFNYLGKIAFEGLKQQTIILDKKIIKEKRSFFSDYVLKAGFLNDGKAEKSNPLLNSYQFPHLTFQEYFSALYVSKLSREEQSRKIQEYKFYPHMQMFFAFLGGLIGDKEFLLGEIEKEPNDLIGLFELFLQINCIREMNKNIVSQDRVDTINKKLLSDSFVDTIYLNLNYEILLEALKQFSKFINFQTFKFYVEVCKEDEHGYHIQKDMVETLIFIADKNDSFQEELEKIEKNFNIEKSILNKVIKDLESINKNNSLIIDALSSLELQENKNLDEELIVARDLIVSILKKYDIENEYVPVWINENLEELINAFYIESPIEEELLFLLEEDDNLKEDCYFVLNILKQPNSGKKLLEVIKSENISIEIKLELVYNLHDYIVYSDEDINLILNIIEKNNIKNEVSIKLVDMALPFCLNKNHNNRIIQILLDRILLKGEDNYRERMNAIETYMDIVSTSNLYVDGLIKIINDETFLYEAIHKLAEVSNQNFYAFEEFFKLEVSKEEEEGVIRDYLRYVNSSIIFEAYEKGFNVCCLIDRSFNDPKKVFYIKDNKFCTIENGQEICVDEKIIERLGDDLDE